MRVCSVTAFFYVDGVNETECVAQKVSSGDKLRRPRCEAFTRAARREMLSAFSLHPEEKPLLRLDPDNMRAPFSMSEG